MLKILSSQQLSVVTISRLQAILLYFNVYFVFISDFVRHAAIKTPKLSFLINFLLPNYDEDFRGRFDPGDFVTELAHTSWQILSLTLTYDTLVK